MQRLRQARLLARLVLAWFALAIGVAVAAPLVQPPTLHVVCTGAAMKVVVQDEEPAQAVASHLLECPACVAVAPPPAAGAFMQQPLPLGHVLEPIPAARLAARTAAALPARGPPGLQDS